MPKLLLALVGLGLIGVSSLSAQTPTTRSVKLEYAESETPSTVNPSPATPILSSNDLNCQPRQDCLNFWVSAEYLLWWVKSAPYPIPLVTTGDPTVGFPAVSTAGAIGQPGTQVLLGNGNAGFGAFSGVRLTLGGWLDDSRQFGMEASGFVLERRTSTFSAASDNAGNPPLYFPGFNVAAGQERALPISDPLRLFAGSVTVTSELQLWGTELNGVFNVMRRPGVEVNFLLGFRYLDLQESLHITNPTTDLLLKSTDLSHDYFGTRNQFYGGQLGTRVSWQRDQWSFFATGKLALGSTHQVVNISGDTTQAPLPGGMSLTPGSFPQGIYAVGTNSGHQSGNQFAVIPALELKLAYQITSQLRALIGYDILYWNQVVRPGNQMDHNINPTQHPVFGAGALSGPAIPGPQFNRTDFWAQGVNIGFEFRY
jgi:Putative beta barrel porin-7 (BBP7)